jgi:hypothetical protein
MRSMYHPYKQGYSTLPGLRKIGLDEVWERNQEESEPLMLDKYSVMASRDCYYESGCPAEILERCAAWIRFWHPWVPSGDFLQVARSIPEDVLVHRVSGGRDWLAAAHLCFPSHWDPLEKIGRTWEEIHRPVPMDLSSSSRIVRAMVNSGPFERFVWSVVYDDRYDFHPSREFSSFSPDGVVLVKVERQVTVPFPDLECCLFILRQYLVRDYDRESLVRAIEGMTPEERAYKGLVEPGPLLGWLKGAPPG